MNYIVVLTVIVSVGAISCVPDAYAKITQGSATGEVTLKYDEGKQCTQISGHIRNLKPGKHGFHIHQFGDFSKGCLSTGGHYNPDGYDHGSPAGDKHHVGDLGNILAGVDGVALVDICVDFVKTAGSRSVLGRAFVVHAGVDDLGLGGDAGSRKTGNAGGRVGCGVIGLKKA